VERASTFDEYWDNLPKHENRRAHWLPSVERTLRENHSEPPAAILALLSPEMMDVFLLATHGLVEVEAEPGRRVNGVYCVECNGRAHRVLLRLLGAQEQVFKGRFEEVVLFKDDDQTGAFPTEDDIRDALAERELRREEEQTDPDLFGKLETKLNHLLLQTYFPFDFINLDFCGRYYSDPPAVDKIHRAVEQILRWQGHPDHTYKWRTFSLAVTWRHLPREMTPEERSLLCQAAARNMSESAGYREALGACPIGS
jgi:hypothetical protein